METDPPRISVAALIARANRLKEEVAGRAAALSIARANEALGNPFRRPDRPGYYPRSLRRYECAERRYNEALKALADIGYAQTAIIINRQCAVRFKAIEQRRYAALMRALDGRQTIGHDQAPGLAFTGGLQRCRETATAGRDAPEGGSPRYAPPRITGRDCAPDAATPSDPATSRSTANAS